MQVVVDLITPFMQFLYGHVRVGPALVRRASKPRDETRRALLESTDFRWKMGNHHIHIIHQDLSMFNQEK